MFAVVPPVSFALYCWVLLLVDFRGGFGSFPWSLTFIVLSLCMLAVALGCSFFRLASRFGLSCVVEFGSLHSFACLLLYVLFTFFDLKVVPPPERGSCLINVLLCL